MQSSSRRLLLALLAALAALAAAPAAEASMLITRDARGISLEVNRKGIALLLYTKPSGQKAHVLVWGAVNSDVEFKYDRSGGWKSRVADWKTFKDACRPYSGPPIPYVAAACTAPDGSHWAVQVWRRIVPTYGGVKGPKELRISHWTGETGKLWVKPDWSWGGQHRHAFGQLTFRGKPVYGRGGRTGYVLDKVGRNILIDSYDSDYGPGWHRVNGLLTNRPSGQFCYGFNRKHLPDGSLSKTGVSAAGRYRASVAGPYVTPDLVIEFGHRDDEFSRDADAPANDEQLGLLDGLRDGSCWPVN